jgi:hypothetical protein
MKTAEEAVEDRDKAIMDARAILRNPYFVLDTETTGLTKAQMCQVAILKYDGTEYKAIPTQPMLTLPNGTPIACRIKQIIAITRKISFNPILSSHSFYHLVSHLAQNAFSLIFHHSCPRSSFTIAVGCQGLLIFATPITLELSARYLGVLRI